MPEMKRDTKVAAPLRVDVTGWLCCGRTDRCKRLDENDEYLVCFHCGTAYSKNPPYKAIDINKLPKKPNFSEPDGDRGALSDGPYAPSYSHTGYIYGRTRW